jgi:single-strand DNA-binding protein
MASLNKVILIGHMTADPEIKMTPSGVGVCSFSIGVNRKYTKGEQSQSDFINIVAWRQQAEFVCKYFKKGQAICICGSLQTRSWTDNSGNRRYATEVVADEVSFVERKEGAQSVKNEPCVPYGYTLPTAPVPAPNFEEISSDEDLPF